MLMFFGSMRNDNEETISVRVEDIITSLFLALSHAILEFMFLYMEAQASKTSFVNYCIVCFNGRFGWVPYNDYLIKTSQQMQEKSQDQKSDEKTVQLDDRVELDFQKI